LDGLLVIVHLHVEGFDVFWIVINDNWTLVDFIGQVFFVLGSKIDTPINFVLELELLLFVLDISLEDLDGLGVRNSVESGVNDVLKSSFKTLLDVLFKEIHIISVVL
jgi:hypothetical protein